MKWPLVGSGNLRDAVCLAQDRDFLTPDEVEQIRDAQDPNDRLALYVHFAKMRIDMMENYLAKEKPGRSIFIHNTLEDYSHIIEAIDTVSDDALRRHKEIDKGCPVGFERGERVPRQTQQDSRRESEGLERYKFVLTEAIDTTSDSRRREPGRFEQARGELAATDAKEKKDREAMMPSKEVKDAQERRRRAKSGRAKEEDSVTVPTWRETGRPATIA